GHRACDTPLPPRWLVVTWRHRYFVRCHCPPPVISSRHHHLCGRGITQRTSRTSPHYRHSCSPLTCHNNLHQPISHGGLSHTIPACQGGAATTRRCTCCMAQRPRCATRTTRPGITSGICDALSPPPRPAHCGP